MARKINVRNEQLQAWKRLSMAIGNEDIPRIRQLMGRAYREGRSVYSMLEDVDRAARRLYRPRGYDEADFQRTFLIYKLGGRSAATIAQRTFGLPSINATISHIVTNPLRSSAQFPTVLEMLSNIQCIYPREQSVSGNIKVGVVMQIDEIKIQERLRWDPRSNMILDIILDCLKKKEIHLATEATVIACSILSNVPSEYAAKPFVISGSCNADRRLYCIASDGDAHRRAALISITLKDKPSPNSRLHEILSPLPLFNMLCGPDEITCDFDWKHVLKHFRNTDLRQRGFSIDGVLITVEILHGHLLSLGISSSTVNSILMPNDKQDVVLMMKLLHAIASLPECDSNAHPSVVATCRVLRLLGKVYFFLLQAYLNVELCLDQQLAYLSAAAHLILALYHINKGDFIPVQLYFNVESMIKNVYCGVSKVQIDNPSGQFWITLLGTDGLEKVFGKVCTMVGGDTNADQLQLTNHIDRAVQCINILEEHPDWGANS
ncbi:hypothetical protein BDQ17DRAFT_1427648 [Cyathus striatus]|nr:hypothetical protein BDQ17DRAFT_1427648 [Cyathus striatus]